MSLLAKWNQGTLRRDDIRKWIKAQSEGKDLNTKELNHVAMCLHHIYLWYKEDLPIGHFLTAVVKNDFIEICGRADRTNSKVLPIYAMFLYNCAPRDYREKAMRDFG